MGYSVHARRKSQIYNDRKGYKFSNIIYRTVASSSSSSFPFGPVRPKRCNIELRSPGRSVFKCYASSEFLLIRIPWDRSWSLIDAGKDVKLFRQLWVKCIDTKGTWKVMNHSFLVAFTNCEKQMLASFVRVYLSVRSSAWYKSASTGRIFIKFDT